MSELLLRAYTEEVCARVAFLVALTYFSHWYWTAPANLD